MTADTIYLPPPSDMEMSQVAKVLRTSAALHTDAAPMTVSLSPAVARRIAHHLDGGGFIDAAEAVAMLVQRDRDRWVGQCQGMMEDARSDKFWSLMILGLALVLFASAACLVFWA